MKLIIPMAGRGKRLRPQSSVTPKPLLSVAGTCMVERIVEGFQGILPRPVTDGVFILGPSFGEPVKDQLTAICARHKMQAHFVIQEEALGTGHAVAVSHEHLQGEGIVVYADTVFQMDSGLQLEGADVVAWVKHVADPSRFGVAVREGERIVAFIEKPQELISNEALIGIYYIRDLALLRQAIDHLFAHEIRGKNGEYYLTDAFDVMLKDGLLFRTAAVNAWLDCGTLNALMDTTRHLLSTEKKTPNPDAIRNSVLNPPVFLAPGAHVKDSVIGPFVSVERDAHIVSSVIRDSIVFEGARIERAVLHDSFVGAHASVSMTTGSVNVGDFSSVQ